MDKDSANILFLGEDSNYYSKIQKKLQSDYPTINFHFRSVVFDTNSQKTKKM